MQDKFTGFLHCSTAHWQQRLGKYATMSKSGIPGFKGLVFIPLGGACSQMHNNVTSRFGRETGGLRILSLVFWVQL